MMNTHRFAAGAARLAVAAAAATGAAAGAAAGAANAAPEVAAVADDEAQGRFCTATTRELFAACRTDALDAFHEARALCINLTVPGPRRSCFASAEEDLAEDRQLCSEQTAARNALCAALGEQRYAPNFDPALFDADFRHLTRPNRYFPLTIGARWHYGGAEVIDVEVLDKTKLIQGVTCIVVRDRVEEDGVVVEDTRDWYAQRKDGTVYYCGESVTDWETFPGDRPMEPELVSIDGSWKTGRDGALPGTQFLAEPFVGAVYRQEFSPNNAEDAARVLSVTYNFGRDADLDRGVPQALARFLCAGNDCVVTEEFSPLEPGDIGRKYYAPGIGLFADVKPQTGETVRLLSCNVDARCAGLPAVAQP